MNNLSKIMQRIEAIVQSEFTRPVVKAIREIGAEAVTFMESTGYGPGEKPELGGQPAEFNSTQVIISIVNDSQANDVVEAIMGVAHTGQKKDGKIFISEIKKTYDISTKQQLTELN